MSPFKSLTAILQGSKTPSPSRPASIPLKPTTLTTLSNVSTTTLTEPPPPYSATRPKYEFPATSLFPIEEEPALEEAPRERSSEQRPQPRCNSDTRPMRPFPFTNLKTLERVARHEHAAEKASRATKTKGGITRGVGAGYGQADADREKELQKLGDVWAGLDTAGETESGKVNQKH